MLRLRSTSSGAVEAEATITGISRMRSFERMAWSTSNPFGFGIIKSSSTRCTVSRSRWSSAWRPSSASRNSYSPFRRTMRRSFRLWDSSSTRRTRYGMVPLLDQGLDLADQLVGAQDRLGDVIVGSRGAKETLAGAFHGVRGGEQDGDPGRGGIALQPARDFQAVNRLPIQLTVGQGDIHDDQVHVPGARALQHQDRVLRHLDLIARFPRQDQLEELGVHRVVFHDQDPDLHALSYSTGTVSGAADGAGNVTVARVPRPTPSLSTVIVPPIP